MMIKPVAYSTGLVALLAITLAGCQPGKELGSISGRVTSKGAPVTEAVVVFTGGPTGTSMTAPVDAEGNYRMETAAGAGLPPGAYQVSVLPPSQEIPLGQKPPFPPPKQYPNIPQNFRDPATSGLSIEVKLGSNQLDIAM